MLSPVGRAGVAIITPLLKANDENAGVANRQALDYALNSARRFRGAITIQLPAGLFYVGSAEQSILALDEYLAGVTIAGMGIGKTVLSPGIETETAPISALSTRVALFSIGSPQAGTITISSVTDRIAQGYLLNDVIYVWQENSGNSRSPSQRLTIAGFPDATTITVNETIATFSSPVRMKHVRGVAVNGPIAVGAKTVTLPSSGLASRLTLGGDVLIGDGPALNNFYGEWARVEDISGATVTLDRRLRRAYGTTVGTMTLGPCIVPGPHMSDITIRDLSIVVPASETLELAQGIIRFGLRVRFENVEFAQQQSGQTFYRPLQIVNCGAADVSNVNFGQLELIASHDTQVRSCEAASVAVNEFSTDLLFDGITTYRPQGFQCASASGPGPCERIHLVNSRITNHGDGSSAANVNFVKASVISNVQIVQPNYAGTPPAISLEDDRITLSAITTDSAISVSGDDVFISQLVSPNGLTLASGSTGILVTPVVPSNATITDNSSGGWRTPVPALLNGRVTLTSSAAGNVPLTIVGHSGQLVNLQEWKNSGGTVVGSMANDGKFTFLGASFTTFTIGPSTGAGTDCFVSSGSLLRMGTNAAGGMIQMFHNGVPSLPGQCYIDCGNDTNSAIFFRTANGTERLRIKHNSDSTFVPPSASGRGLVVKGASSQTGDLQQWQDISANVLFAIRADGHIASTNIESSTPPGSPNKRLLIYDEGGTQIGYIPIHPLS
jgi:hypothetical protein